jgi:hypothetical protein
MFTEPRFHQKDESTDSVLKSNLSLCLCQQHTVRTIQSKGDGEKHTAESLSLLLPESEHQYYMNGEPGIFSKHFSFICCLNASKG